MLFFGLPKNLCACGYPIAVTDKESGEPKGWFSSPPPDFSLEHSSCLKFNDCNTQFMLFSLSAGRLLFSSKTSFCSPEEKKELRWAYLKEHILIILYLVVLIGVVFKFVIRSPKKSTLDEAEV